MRHFAVEAISLKHASEENIKKLALALEKETDQTVRASMIKYLVGNKDLHPTSRGVLKAQLRVEENEQNYENIISLLH